MLKITAEIWRRVAEDMPTTEIKKTLLHLLLQADSQLPLQLLSLATKSGDSSRMQAGHDCAALMHSAFGWRIQQAPHGARSST